MGFGVWGLVCGVWGLGIWAWGVEGLGCQVWGERAGQGLVCPAVNNISI